MLIGGRTHSLEDIEYAGEMGLDFAEISLIYPQEDSVKIGLLKELKNRFNLFYLAHGPKEGDPWDVGKLKSSFVPRIKELIKLAKELDISILTIHFWIDRRFLDKTTISEKIHILEEMVNYGVRKDVVVSIENLSEDWEDFSPAFERIKDLGLTLDIAHGELLTERNTSFQLMENLGHRLRHVHIHDNRGGNSVKDDLHLPLGEGTIDFRAILKELLRIQYFGTLAMEIKPQWFLKGREMIEKIIQEVVL